jgi:hypothetical protein
MAWFVSSGTVALLQPFTNVLSNGTFAHHCYFEALRLVLTDAGPYVTCVTVHLQMTHHPLFSDFIYSGNIQLLCKRYSVPRHAHSVYGHV